MTNKWLKHEIRRMIREINTNRFLCMIYACAKTLYEEERGVGE